MRLYRFRLRVWRLKLFEHQCQWCGRGLDYFGWLVGGCADCRTPGKRHRRLKFRDWTVLLTWWPKLTRAELEEWKRVTRVE